MRKEKTVSRVTHPKLLDRFCVRGPLVLVRQQSGFRRPERSRREPACGIGAIDGNCDGIEDVAGAHAGVRSAREERGARRTRTFIGHLNVSGRRRRLVVHWDGRAHDAPLGAGTVQPHLISFPDLQKTTPGTRRKESPETPIRLRSFALLRKTTRRVAPSEVALHCRRNGLKGQTMGLCRLSNNPLRAPAGGSCARGYPQ